MGEIGSGNGSNYPGAIDSDAALEVNASAAGKTKARAEVVNDLAAAIIALETELGTDPAGTLTNVKTFLQTEHETTGAHKATHVVTISGTQTITGTKTFANLIASGFMTVSGTLGVSGTMHGSMIMTANQKISKTTPQLQLQRGSSSDNAVLSFLNEGGTRIGGLFLNGASDDYELDDGSTVRVAFNRTDGKMTAGTVPLARVEGYTGSKVIDVGSLNAGSVVADAITVTGAALGDFVLVSSSIDTGGVLVIGSVEATDQVQLIFYNATAGVIDLASATYYAKVIKKDF